MKPISDKSHDNDVMALSYDLTALSARVRESIGAIQKHAQSLGAFFSGDVADAYQKRPGADGNADANSTILDLVEIAGRIADCADDLCAVSRSLGTSE